MFDRDFYLELFNREFASSLDAPIASADVATGPDRILKRIEAHLKKHPLATFNHYRPARFLAENVASLTIRDATLDRSRTDKWRILGRQALVFLLGWGLIVVAATADPNRFLEWWLS